MVNGVFKFSSMTSDTHLDKKKLQFDKKMATDETLLVADPTIVTKYGRELSHDECNIMNIHRMKEFGKNETKDFHQDYPSDSQFFFVILKKHIVAFGTLRPITIEFNDKTYNILGFCNIISIIKQKGYGKHLIHSMIEYINKSQHTALGFCYSKVSPFYKKCGLMIEPDFIQRFQ